MFGVKGSGEFIKGKFAEKFVEELLRIFKLKAEGKDLHFENKDRKKIHNVIKKDDI